MHSSADFPLVPQTVSTDRHDRPTAPVEKVAGQRQATDSSRPSRKPVPAVEQSPAMQRLLRLFQRKSDLSVSDMAAEAFIGINTLACGGYVSALKKAGYIHVSGWRKTRRGFSTPLYSRGDQPDLPRPEYDDAERAAPGMDLIVNALLRRGPMSYPEIAAVTGLSLHTIKNSGYLSALRTQRRVHICDWRRARKGPMTPIYDAGAGSDAPKPETFSSAEKSRRYRERKDLLHGDRSLAAQTSRLLSRSSAIHARA